MSTARHRGTVPGGRRYQARVLTERYWHCMLGDVWTLLLLLAQAPLIGWLCTVVWGSVREDTSSLHFVLCLSAVWFGCVNACREVVKERGVLERERFFGLSLVSYVWSKVSVLGVLGLVQVLSLQVAVEWELAVRGPFLVQTFALWGASVCGTGLGLLASALSRTQERAVAAIPLLLLPQILFSEFAIPEAYFNDTVEVVEKLMPVRWAYRVFEECAALEPGWGWAALSLLVMIGYAAVLHGLVVLALVPRREA